MVAKARQRRITHNEIRDGFIGVYRRREGKCQSKDGPYESHARTNALRAGRTSDESHRPQNGLTTTRMIATIRITVGISLSQR